MLFLFLAHSINFVPLQKKGAALFISNAHISIEFYLRTKMFKYGNNGIVCAKLSVFV